MAHDPKYTYPKAVTAKRDDILKQTRDRIQKTKDYKPTKLPVKQNEYSNNLPKRPGMPKLPKLSNLKSKKVDKPSGLPGKIKEYKPKKTKLKEQYPNLPKGKSKGKPSFDVPKPNKSGPFKGLYTTKKAPGVTIKKKGKK